MEIIYEFTYLIECLKSIIRLQKLTFGQVSKGTSIHPSYFSRAMQGKGSFSQNQIFKICHFLSLDLLGLEYILLLWNKHESQTKLEKEYFEEKIRRIRNEQLKISKQIDSKLQNKSLEAQKTHSEVYFAEAITAWVHIYLTIPEYQRNPLKILEKIKISESKLIAELNKLERLNIIKIRNLKVIEVQNSVHLDESSDFSFTNHINWRLKSIQKLEDRNSQIDDYHLSVTFSADSSTKHQLKQLLRKMALESKNLVANCNAQNAVYHLMIDLY